MDQKKCGKVLVAITKAMEEYALLGDVDCIQVNWHLKEAMKIVAGHLTEQNQEAFEKWLLAKIKENENKFNIKGEEP